MTAAPASITVPTITGDVQPQREPSIAAKAKALEAEDGQRLTGQVEPAACSDRRFRCTAVERERPQAAAQTGRIT